LYSQKKDRGIWSALVVFLAIVLLMSCIAKFENDLSNVEETAENSHEIIEEAETGFAPYS
jgi:hypothetical protein